MPLKSRPAPSEYREYRFCIVRTFFLSYTDIALVVFTYFLIITDLGKEAFFMDDQARFSCRLEKCNHAITTSESILHIWLANSLALKFFETSCNEASLFSEREI